MDFPNRSVRGQHRDAVADSIDAVLSDRERLINALQSAGAVVNDEKKIRCLFHDDQTPSAFIKWYPKSSRWRFICKALSCGKTCEDYFGVEAKRTSRQRADVIREFCNEVRGDSLPSGEAQRASASFFEKQAQRATIGRGESVVPHPVAAEAKRESEPSPRTLAESVPWMISAVKNDMTHEKKGRPTSVVAGLVVTYVHADGRVQFIEQRFDVRYADGSGDKTVRPFTGGRWKGPSGKRCLHRLPDVVASAGPILVTEGAKCGIVANLDEIMPWTAWSGVACGVSQSDWSPLAGREVWFWPDVGGESVADTLVPILDGLKPPARVSIIRGHGLTDDGDDVEQWREGRGTDETPESLRAAIAAMAESITPVAASAVDTTDRAWWANASEPSNVVTEQPIIVAKRRWPKPMARAAFIGPIGEFVQRIAPYTEADPAAMLVQALASFGSIIGRHAYVMVGGNEQHANLFAVIVGESALARKGTSWGIVRSLMRQVAPDWCNDRITEGFGSGEAVIFKVHDGVWVEEKTRKGGSIQYERVQKSPPVADKRLHIHEEEFKVTLTVCLRHGSTLSAIIRKAWDGGKLEIATKNNPMSASNAHVSMTAHITVQELNESLDATATMNGFGNRYLWVGSKRANVLPRGDKSHLQEVGDLVERLNEAVRRGRIKREFQWTAGALALWEDFYLNKPAPKGNAGELTKRDDTYIHRLAMIYAILDDQCDGWMHERHFHAAKAVWDYCKVRPSAASAADPPDRESPS